MGVSDYIGEQSERIFLVSDPERSKPKILMARSGATEFLMGRSGAWSGATEFLTGRSGARSGATEIFDGSERSGVERPVCRSGAERSDF